MENLNQVLRESLANRGVDAEAEGTWLRPVGQAHVLRARLFETEMEGVFRLGVQMPFGDGRLLTESFLSKAETKDEAGPKGIAAFEEHALPVISAAFLGGETGGAVTVETWETKHGPLKAWVGKLAFHAESEQVPNVPENLRQTLKEMVHDRQIGHRHHWLRLVVVQRDGEVMTEVLWDNEVWRDAEAAIQHLDWKPSEDFSSYRMHIGFEFESAAESMAGRPNAVIEAENFLSTLFHLPIEDQTDEAGLLDLLDRMGFDDAYVRRALQMVPIALGRQLLADTEQPFSDTWVALDADGEELARGSLQDEPVFTEAMHFDQDAIGNAFGLYATNSVEVLALNKLAEDEDAEPWTAPPVLIFRDPPTLAGMAKGEALLEAHAEAVKAESGSRKGNDQNQVTKKPWWKFW